MPPYAGQRPGDSLHGRIDGIARGEVNLAMDNVLSLVDLAFDEESDSFLDFINSAQSVNCGSSESIGC